MQVQIRINENKEDLYCNECKNKISVSEKYVIVNEEIYYGEIIDKPHHLECLPETEDEDLYLPDEE